MKKYISLISLLCLLVSCQEFEPVFTEKYPQPQPYDYTVPQANATIADLAARLPKSNRIKDKSLNGVEITENIIIEGRVSTTDQPGNFYKSLYIQDETGGMEIKLGRNGLYNEYHEGQRIVIKCSGLYVGDYGSNKKGNGYGMAQLGYTGEGTDYQTSYMEVPLLINKTVFKGDPNDIQKVTPVKITTADQLPDATSTLATCSNIGKLVTVSGLYYGWHDPQYDEDNGAFVLLYINSLQDKEASSNRIFITGTQTGIDTWALSKERMTQSLLSGKWDSFNVGNATEAQSCKFGTVGDLRGDGSYPGVDKAAYSVSHYFTVNLPGSNGSLVPIGIQVRTSGYCKFADTPVPQDVLNGTRPITVTGILNMYEGKIQLTVNNITDIEY